MDITVGWCTEFEIKRRIPSLSGLSTEASDALSGSDIAYFSSHGRMDGNSCYQFRLRRGEWAPTSTAINGGPSVLVLDTCNVTTSQIKAHQSAWLTQGRPTPALVLGFVGAATDGYSESMRGRAFAEHLAAGNTFVQSWFNAIQDTQAPRRRDQGVAIGFGPTLGDANATLDTATLTNVPAPTVADACAWRTQ
jgi:hypothetical protein